MVERLNAELAVKTHPPPLDQVVIVVSVPCPLGQTVGGNTGFKFFETLQFEIFRFLDDASGIALGLTQKNAVPLMRKFRAVMSREKHLELNSPSAVARPEALRDHMEGA